jgi:peptide/nickel transport system substrate-binding protein
MKVDRRQLMAGAAATAATATLGGTGALAQAARPSGTLRVIPHASLTILDPVATTGYIVRNHGYLIYDTLFAMDEQLRPQPQMASGVEISQDRLTYRIGLRDGLAWHDGSPVTSADCVPSLTRWGRVDGLGQRLMSYVDSIETDGPRTIVIKLKRPYGLVLHSIGKLSTNVPFMMPRRFAEKPTTERTTADEQIGSGPFRFVRGEFRPGARVVYERNPNYVPRSEPPSNAAGGKRVNLERVEWINFPDPTTALNALISGEVDYYEQVPADLLQIAARAPGVKTQNFNPLGNVGMARFNHLVAPSNNVGVRRAIAQALNQRELLQAMIGNADFLRPCFSVFPCGTTFDTQIGNAIMQQGNLDAARATLRASGYNGERLVLLATTDIPIQTAMAQVVADACRRIGMNVDAQAMDWATVLQRRTSRNPVDQGGWNMFFTWWEGADLLDPVVQFALSGAGERAWVGWPNDPQMETLRSQFAEAGDAAEQKRLADAVQARALEQMYQVYTGMFFVATGFRDNVSGILNAPPFFWNITKRG